MIILNKKLIDLILSSSFGTKTKDFYGNYFVVDEKLKTILKNKKIKENLIYIYDGSLYKAAIFNNHYYQLKIFKEIPILEIDGLRMHLIKDFKTPFDYGKELVKELKIKKNSKILECCVGLGYITKELLRFGYVVGIEKSKEVLELAKINPFSKHLFNSKNLKLIISDVIEFLKDDKEEYDYIIHDPPRYSLAPSLYSSGCYNLFYNHLKKGGKLYHYVGSLGSKKGRKIEEEVIKRLKKVGFKRVVYYKKLQAVIGEK